MFLAKDSKSPYYQLIYFVNGKRTKISTRTTNKKAAEKFLATFNPEPKSQKQSVSISISLNDFISEYKKYVQDTYSVKYLKKAVVPSFNRLQNFLSDKPLDSISSKDIDQFIASVYVNAKYAASLYHRTLKAAFNKAVVWNYIKSNPFDKIKSPKISKSFPLFISEAELILILNKTENKLLKDIFTTAFYTGMRLNEILYMKWNWIDLNENVITIRNSSEFRTKSKKDRLIPIHSKVRNILLSRFNPDLNQVVFYRIAGIKLNGEFISKKFKKAVRDAKLNQGYHFHTLRHSFASNLVQRGTSLYTVKELLGHENIKTTQIYFHLQSDNLAQAVNLL